MPYGKVYVRRRILGTVPLLADGSAHFHIPGGLPIVLHLADDSESARAGAYPAGSAKRCRSSPGETPIRRSPRFFNSLCGGCHGSISGPPLDAASAPTS